MFELMRFRKAIDKYEVLIYSYPETAKENKKIFTKDIKDLLDFLNKYMDDEAEELKVFCDLNVELYYSEDTGIFKKIKNYIGQRVVDYKINKISRNLEKAEFEEQRLKGVLHRFEQYSFLL